MRQQFRQTRRDLLPCIQQQAAEQLLQQLLAANLLDHQQHLAVYLSQDGEISCEVLIKWCWENGRTTYLPVLDPDKPGHLLFLPYTDNTQLVANQFAIPEPKLEDGSGIAVADLDLILLPLVAFDITGNRLGMGGGFYDRTLASKTTSDTSQTRLFPRRFGLAHDCQQAQQLHTESWDIPLNKIITPTRIISVDQ